MANAMGTLVEIIEQYQHHLNLDSKLLIESFLEKARSFRDFCQYSSPTDFRFMNRITDVAHRAEDIVEFQIMNQSLRLPAPGIADTDLLALTGLMEEMKQEMMEDIDANRLQSYLPLHEPVLDVPSSSTKLDPTDRRKNIIVGLDHHFQTIRAQLIDAEASQLLIIPILGVAGLGKTTLARKLYDDYFIASHFDTRAWVTMPFEQDMKVHLLLLLESLGKLTDEMHRQDADQLGVHIRKALKNNKYFIVIDDVWLVDAMKKFSSPDDDVLYNDKDILETMLKFFPNDDVGGRILLTSFFDEVESVGNVNPHHLTLLSRDNSRFLLYQTVFGQECCPDELKQFGEIILRMCSGFPQAIALIAGILATSWKTPQFWGLISDSFSRYSDQCRSIKVNDTPLLPTILLSYVVLPCYLKPCLLYLGAFPVDYEIRASKIIKLWIAEGFVKQIGDKSLEDLAEAYLITLINKNLILLSREESNGRIKTFRIQGSLRNIFLILAQVENFLWFEKSTVNLDEDTLRVRRVGVHPLFKPSDEMKLLSVAHSFLFTGRVSPRLAPMFTGSRFLRVLDVFRIEFYQFPSEILQLVLLRYLAFSCHSDLPTSISSLCNLQTLIIRRLPTFRAFSLPCELWGMSQLRHVKCKETLIWYYPRNRTMVIHRKLQTLSSVQLFGVRNDFLEKIPNIRKLGIFCNTAMQSVFDLSCLNKLEILRCSSDWSLASSSSLSYLTFPPSLRKINLRLCRIPCGFMKVVGSLPHLEQLKLQKSDFLCVDSGSTEPEWEIADEEFPQLLYLVMVDLNLVHWKARSTHFPRLRRLTIRNCCAMKDIPLDIGDIQTLELIQVNKTNPSLVASVMQIEETQKARADTFLQVHVTRH